MRTIVPPAPLAAHCNPALASFAAQRDAQREYREQRIEEARQEIKAARKPDAPLALAVEKAVEKKRAVGLQMLEHLDTMHCEVERLALLSPTDAAPLAKALLCVEMRLAWVQLSGKVLTCPEPETVPHRLWLRQAVTKPAMRRLHHAMNKLPMTGKAASELLECSRAMIVWLADDGGAKVEFKEVASNA